MDTFSNSIDLVRIVFLLGAVLALAYKKQFGITPGGIIAPGILTVLMFTSFSAFVATLISTIVCWGVYRIFLSKQALSSHWFTLICISLSVATGLAANAVFTSPTVLNQEVIATGLVVPGLFTISAKKYGISKTASATLLVTAATGAIGLLIANALPYTELTALNARLSVYESLKLTHPYIVLPISLITAILAYYRFGIRSGGYLIAPFIAVLIVSCPTQAALMALGVIASYLTVKLIQKHTLIIGLERFVVSLFCGYFAVSLIDFLAVTIGIQNYHSSPLILITAVAVVTNDLTLQPPKQALKKGIAPSMFMSLLARLAA